MYASVLLSESSGIDRFECFTMITLSASALASQMSRMVLAGRGLSVWPAYRGAFHPPDWMRVLPPLTVY